MSGEAQAILDQAMKLPAKEREQLAELLFDSAFEMDPDIKQAWVEEIHRRWARIESGEDQLIPGEVVEREIDEKLEKSRARKA